ncbi:MAG: secretin N-terminal domain-containing protein [Gemmatimonadaceae bacterium]
MKLLRLIQVTLLTLLAGCAAQQAFDEGRSRVESGDFVGGMLKVEEAKRLDPANAAYREYAARQRELALQQALALADAARLRSDWNAAEAAYRHMLEIDPRNTRAQNGIASVAAERRHRAALDEAQAAIAKGDAAGALARIREVLAENPAHRDALRLLRQVEERSARAAIASPELSAALKKPVTIEFRDVTIKQVFELLSRNTGLNFVFDRDVRPDLRTTVFVRDTPIDEVMRFILLTNQLDRKVLNANTVLIYPNTQAKQRDYQELVVKSFYLTNVDVKQMANTIKTLVKTKDLIVDEKLNLLVMRDTPEAVRMAERLVRTQDLAEPEVMLELEVMEVGTNVLQDLGIQYPSQVSYSLIGGAGTPGTITLPEWLNRDSNLVRLTVSDPFLVLNLKNETNRTNVLANPRIRVKSHEKAKIHIGDKVPVITNTSTSTGFVAESVNYLDVGLKLDVEPAVTLDDEVGIKVGLEVSNIVQQIKSASGTLTYQLGTRNASTTLRLKDGETQVLAGLISDEDRKTIDQIPGLGELPLIGRLFGNHSDNTTKTEIILLITPHIIRNIARPDVRLEEFASGTEGAIGAAPLNLLPAAAAPKRP